MCISNPYLHTLHKRNTKTYATCVNFSMHWIFCARILNTFHTICVSIGKFHSLFAFSNEKFTQSTKNLRDRRSHRSRQISSLGFAFTLLPKTLHFMHKTRAVVLGNKMKIPGFLFVLLRLTS